MSWEPLPKIHLEQVEKQFDDLEELIQQISQLTVQEIEKWIEDPHASISWIHIFIKEWKKIRREDISSQIYKTEI